MLRRLLTCLALLSGIVATGVPAQAEVATAVGAGIEASVAADGNQQAQDRSSVASAMHATAFGWVPGRRLFVQQPAPVTRVWVRIDRARE